MARRGRSPSPAPRRSAAPAKTQQYAPAPQHQPTQVAQAQPKQPGLFAQMAATAGGVAVGSAIGHTVGHAVTGMFGGSSSNEVQPQAQAQPLQTMPMEQSGQQGGACAFEIKQFLQCAQNNDDISLCSGFNEAIRQCKETNRLM
jgi:hypothetical protein